MVVTTKTANDSTIWLVKGGAGEIEISSQAKPLLRDDVVRLEHIATGTNLHSHSAPSPILGDQQEVTAYGSFGNGDSNDNWKVEPESENAWLSGQAVRLIHNNTLHNLHSHPASHPKFTAGYQEVTGFGGRDNNDLWIAEIVEEPSSAAQTSNEDHTTTSRFNHEATRSIALQRLNESLTQIGPNFSLDAIPDEVRTLCDAWGFHPGSSDMWRAIFNDWCINSAFKWSPSVLALFEQVLAMHAAQFSRLGLERFLPQVTPRIIYLSALLFGHSTQGSGNLFFTLTNASELTEAQIRKLLAAEFIRAEGAPQSFEVAPTELADFANRANEVRRATGEDSNISDRHLLFSLLDGADESNTGTYRSSDGVEWETLVRAFRAGVQTDPGAIEHDDAEAWSSALEALEDRIRPTKAKPSRPIEVGSRNEWGREAGAQEAGLRVDDYAEILASVYAKAGQGEFSLVLFGHWGRGKSFLISRLGKRLEDDNYKTVVFSAWKFPSTPEVWVHLYETLADHVCAGPALVTLPRVIRTGISRHSPWPIIVALCSLALSLTPKIWLSKILAEEFVELVRVLGIGGVIWLAMFAWGVRRTRAKLVQNYITATRHTERLGLQATIGSDLKALLDGWMPRSRVWSWAFTAYLAITGWLGLTAWKWFEFSTFRSGGMSELRGWAAAAVVLVMALLAIWVLVPWKKPARLLLVIDDLDRCDNRQLLHVVESLKLLTEDPCVSRRIQVAALVDEDIFEHAILTKHRDLQKAHCANRFTLSRIIRENREKLFTAHLRLPELDPKELINVLDLVIAHDRKPTELAKVVTGSQSGTNDNVGSGQQETGNIDSAAVDWARQADRTNTVASRSAQRVSPSLEEITFERTAKGDASKRRESVLAQEKSTTPATPLATDLETTASLLQVNFRFSKDEEDSLSAAVETLGRLKLSGPWGPRSVRSFVFRYQLARLLTTRLGVKNWTPKLICDLMVEQSNPQGGQELTANHPALAKIVSQVA